MRARERERKILGEGEIVRDREGVRKIYREYEDRERVRERES